MKQDLLAAAFGSRAEAAAAYQHLLATDGIVEGLLGPREAPQLLERHLLPSAALAQLIPRGGSHRAVDVGSGAGLPGIPLALACPDLPVTLVEPLERRVSFLQRAVKHLELSQPSGESQLRVLRGRADVVPDGSVGVVVARALAPALRLAAWCMPLLQPAGILLAPKGQRVTDELRDLQPHLAALDIAAVEVVEVSDAAGAPVRVLQLQRGSGRVSPAARRTLGRALRGPDLHRQGRTSG